METHNAKSIDGENIRTDAVPSSTASSSTGGGGTQGDSSLLREVARPVASSVRGACRNWRALIACFAVYLLWLLTLWMFFTIGEASFGQIALTFALMLVAPALFFLLQAMILDAAEGVTSWRMIGPTFRRWLKIGGTMALVSLPLIICAALTFFVLDKLDARFRTANTATASERREDGVDNSNTDRESGTSSARSVESKVTRKHINWPLVLLGALRYLLLGLVLPLAIVHLWIASARADGGLRTTIKNVGRILRRAFATRAVIIYLLGLLIFVAAPHLIIVTPTRVENNWIELALVGMRLALALALVFVGWVLTLHALTTASAEESTIIMAGR